MCSLFLLAMNRGEVWWVNFDLYFLKKLIILVRIKESCFLSLALPFLLATSESKSGNGFPFPQLFAEAVP